MSRALWYQSTPTALIVVPRHPEAEGAMVEGGRSPSPPRNWGLVVETPYYLQVAPFPKKLFGH